MARTTLFDITHLVSRLPIADPSGIDKVDMAFAQHYFPGNLDATDAVPTSRHTLPVHYGVTAPRCHSAEDAAALCAMVAESRWRSPALDQDTTYKAVLNWLVRGVSASAVPAAPCGRQASWLPPRWHHRRAQLHWRVARGRHPIPHGATYLNVAQHAFEYPRFFRWLARRPDVRAVMMVHDLLPLDLPEYFKPGYKPRFQCRLETIMQHADALITTSHAVADRIRGAFEAAGRRQVRIHTAHLPSTLATDVSTIAPGTYDNTPYFMIVGTIEPRKNHLLLLNIWRRLADVCSRPPKLLVVGVRGWENEQVFDMLDRCPALGSHVLEVTGLSDAGLAALLKHARALLMPSFGEGYGLPIVEALSLGTPVVASDIPVFREVAQGRANFLSYLDGPGWSRMIMELADSEHTLAKRSRALIREFEAPDWSSYFAGIDRFLEE